MEPISWSKLFRFVSFGSLMAVSLLLGSPTSASSAPIVIQYEDHYYETHTMNISNVTTFDVVLPIVNPPTIMRLPRFDAGLGELLSVDLRIVGAIFGHFTTHCEGPIACNTDGGGTVSTGLGLTDTGSLLGVDLGPPLSLLVFDSRQCSFAAFPFADCSREWTKRDSETRFLSFSGADVEGFVGTGDFPFYGRAGEHLRMTMRHEGLPPASPGGGGDVDAAGYGASLPGILDLLEVAYDLYLNDVFDNHGIVFSDAHLHAQGHFQARVSYTYEPTAASVPEPSLLALIGLALGGFGRARRRTSGAP